MGACTEIRVSALFSVSVSFMLYCCFTKGNFLNFFFMYLNDETVQIRGPLVKKQICIYRQSPSFKSGGGRVVRRCWVNLQCWGVLLIWIIVGQGPVALAVGAGGGCLDIFSLICPFSPLSPSLWETARYRLKYCLKGPLNPKQPTNQPILQKLIHVVGGRSGQQLIS